MFSYTEFPGALGRSEALVTKMDPTRALQSSLSLPSICGGLTTLTASLSGGWVPETSWSFHCWQPATRRRLHRWLAKPDNPVMSPHAPKKTGTHHTVESGGGGGEGEGKTLNAPHKTLLLPVTPINKLYNPKHEESDICANMTKPVTTIDLSRS